MIIRVGMTSNGSNPTYNTRKVQYTRDSHGADRRPPEKKDKELSNQANRVLLPGQGGKENCRDDEVADQTLHGLGTRKSHELYSDRYQYRKANLNGGLILSKRRRRIPRLRNKEMKNACMQRGQDPTKSAAWGEVASKTHVGGVGYEPLN
ncbi:uncharacterized protein BT62DRAFT_995273 [Guyanagaster necrorhizus]|uniref:Uncharacterized protein n=1 Tax=Guyanagaster necrorhizus TaxID=856835 RepID=A0A9P7VQX1_9AGAR|nr:uncharacterized protein BT62DRAFT_995273 [Guyanagaster necrorhizus MCA 3950]KAG7444810.1 hypothetical protein BT62DRAFT_995273 [Guyanagaster necrorhizus MCA 3950]